MQAKLALQTQQATQLSQKVDALTKKLHEKDQVYSRCVDQIKK
jgi:hypothetical protein